MNKPFRQHWFDRQQANGLLVSLQIFNKILHWLAGFIQLTEEERGAAGIYLGNQYPDNNPVN
jgi:hypothetical protein